MKGTLITLRYQSNKQEEALKEVFNIVSKVHEKVLNGKIRINIEINKKGCLYYHLFVNEKLENGMEKECIHGHCLMNYMESTEQCKQAIKYIGG